MKVAEWINNHPDHVITVAPDCSLEEAMHQMLAEPCLRDIYVVSEDGRLIGHLSHKKLAQTLLAEHRPVHTRRQIIERVAGGTARELMDSEFVHARPDEELDDVLHSQLEHDIEDLPVIDEEGVLLGVVNMSTVLKEMKING